MNDRDLTIEALKVYNGKVKKQRIGMAIGLLAYIIILMWVLL